MSYCQIKFLNHAPGQVITHIGVTFTYDDGSVSSDPSNLPTNGLKEVNIPHGESSYCFGQNDKCVKKFWWAMTWTNGHGSGDSESAPTGYCWSTPTIELAPALLATADAKEPEFEFIVQDSNTGEKRRVAVELSDEARKAIAATTRR